MVSLPSPSTVLLRLSMLRAERDLASLRTLAEAGEHGFAEEAPLSADNEPFVSSLLDLHDDVVSVSVDLYSEDDSTRILDQTFLSRYYLHMEYYVYTILGSI